MYCESIKTSRMTKTAANSVKRLLWTTFIENNKLDDVHCISCHGDHLTQKLTLSDQFHHIMFIIQHLVVLVKKMRQNSAWPHTCLQKQRLQQKQYDNVSVQLYMSFDHHRTVPGAIPSDFDNFLSNLVRFNKVDYINLHGLCLSTRCNFTWWFPQERLACLSLPVLACSQHRLYRHFRVLPV